MAEYNRAGGFKDGGHRGGFKGRGGIRPRFAAKSFAPKTFSAGGYARGSSRNNSSRPLFKATCANCEKPCELPFRPSGERPVYCKDCFDRQQPQGEFERRDTPRNFVRNDAPRHSIQSPAENRGMEEIKKEMAALNRKLDSVLEMLGKSPRRAPQEESSMLDGEVKKSMKKQLKKKVDQN